MLTRTDNSTINTKVYHQETHTEKVTKHKHITESIISNKKSCVRSLIKGINMPCNTKLVKNAEPEFLYSKFIKNYPENFINKVLTKIGNIPLTNITKEQAEESRA